MRLISPSKRLIIKMAIAMIAAISAIGPVATPAFAAVDPTPQAATTAAWTLRAWNNISNDVAHVYARFTAPEPSQGAFLLDLEIYDATGVKVKQAFAVRVMSSYQTSEVALHWPLDQVRPGSYTVKLGVFDADWAPKFAWNDNASVIRVDRPTAVDPKDPDEGDPLAGAVFYGPNVAARNQATAWRTSRPEDAALMDRLGSIPTAKWFSGWETDVASAVERTTREAEAARRIPVLVAYNIPDRDCSNHSSGGAVSEAAYMQWIRDFAWGIGGRKAVVIIEPDALAQNCGDVDARYRMLNAAVDLLGAKPGVVAYLDAGNAGWIPVAEMSERLRRAGIERARGFSLNVASFKTTAGNINYGHWLSLAVGGKRFVIDTSRNGSGWNGEWCNPPGRSFGIEPTTRTEVDTVDAYLWVKTPGLSDGPCNGGPKAGTWWADAALDMARRTWLQATV